MNDAVVSHDVSFDNFGIIDFDAIFGVNGEVLALQALGGFHSSNIGGEDFASDDMVGQNSGELGFVSEQGIEVSLWHFGKSFVGGRENRERAWAFEGIDQTSDFECLG